MGGKLAKREAGSGRREERRGSCERSQLWAAGSCVGGWKHRVARIPLPASRFPHSRSPPAVVLPSSRLRNGPTSQRSYPHGPRLGPEAGPVIDDEPLLVLPLVHHLVKQCMQGFVPSIAPDVSPAQHDFRHAAFARRAVVAEPALHPPGDSYRNLAEHAVESFVVVHDVPPGQLADKWKVGGVRSLGAAPSAGRIVRARDRELEDGSARLLPQRSASAVDENDYRFPDLFVGAKKAVVDAEIAPAIADDNGSIGRESHAILPAQTEALKTD